MKKILYGITIVITFLLLVVPLAVSEPSLQSSMEDGYGIQWQENYGPDPSYGARYEGPQPIGDCDNDGDNELLIGGRDAMLRIMEWNSQEQTYVQTHILRCPFYKIWRILRLFNEEWAPAPMDADGFAIGDLTGDGKNEIAVSWYASMYRYIGGKYRLIGWNNWIEEHGGGSPDCYIGDCDNDGQNELIISCRDWYDSVPEIVVFKWNGWRLVKVYEWDDPGINGEIFMAGLGDTDQDGENEIVCGSGDKVVVLDFDRETASFIPTIIQNQPGQGWENHPFACVCKDSDMDGLVEIHVGYFYPRITIFEWNGTLYEVKYDKIWPDEGVLIEALDVGDVDDDGTNEVCAGTDLVHILQWDGNTYVEEALLNTFGHLAVMNIGDSDNDGKNELNVGSVIVDEGQDFMEWIYKYGWEPRS